MHMNNLDGKINNDLALGNWLRSEISIDKKELVGKKNSLKISIIVPSLNQGKYIEDTICSILLQNYANYELIVMDGGSIDDTLQILSKYRQSITFLSSKSDDGQASAVNEGINLCSGDVICYLNSDDLLLPDALLNVNDFFTNHPEIDLVIGKSLIINSQNQIVRSVWGVPPTYLSLLYWGCGGFNQPASFWRRGKFFEVGSFDPTLHFSFDYDFYIKIAKMGKIGHLNKYLAAFRIHPDSKTSTMNQTKMFEDNLLRQKYGYNDQSPLVRWVLKWFFQIRYWVWAGYSRVLQK